MVRFFKSAVFILFFLGCVPVQAAQPAINQDRVVRTRTREAEVQFNLYVAEKLVGCAKIKQLNERAGEWKLSLLIIYPGHQNNGYGHHLMDHVKKYLEEKRAKKIKIVASPLWSSMALIISVGMGYMTLDTQPYNQLFFLLTVFLGIRCRYQLLKLIKLYSSYGARVTSNRGLLAHMEIVFNSQEEKNKNLSVDKEEKGTSVVFRLYLGDKDIGYLSLGREASQEWYLHMLRIHNQYRNKGYAHFLFKHMLNYLKQEGAKRVHFDACPMEVYEGPERDEALSKLVAFYSLYGARVIRKNLETVSMEIVFT